MKAAIRKLKEYNLEEILYFFISVLLLNISITHAEDKSLKVEVLIAGDWGTKEGQFGIERTGKVELGYALDFFVTADSIYILDSINNRIQVFDLQGNLKEIINLQIQWQNFGLPIWFTLAKNQFYMLVGKPPHYSENGIREINTFSYDGKFIKKFGKEYIPRKGEEYYYKILSVPEGEYILCGLGGIKVLAFDTKGFLKKTVLQAKDKELIELMGIDSDGNPIIEISQGKKQRRTILLNMKKKNLIEKKIDDLFLGLDKKNNFYFIKSIIPRNSSKIVTELEVYNDEKKLSKKYKITGDIKVKRNNQLKVFRAEGNFTEISKVDAEGNIYQLLALNDGVILRKIAWKEMK